MLFWWLFNHYTHFIGLDQPQKHQDTLGEPFLSSSFCIHSSAGMEVATNTASTTSNSLDAPNRGKYSPKVFILLSYTFKFLCKVFQLKFFAVEELMVVWVNVKSNHSCFLVKVVMGVNFEGEATKYFCYAWCCSSCLIGPIDPGDTPYHRSDCQPPCCDLGWRRQHTQFCAGTPRQVPWSDPTTNTNSTCACRQWQRGRMLSSFPECCSPYSRNKLLCWPACPPSMRHWHCLRSSMAQGPQSCANELQHPYHEVHPWWSIDRIKGSIWNTIDENQSSPTPSSSLNTKCKWIFPHSCLSSNCTPTNYSSHYPLHHQPIPNPFLTTNTTSSIPHHQPFHSPFT